MYSNIACSVPGCTSPVIGQCPGYKGGCGRYYCAAHSTDGLCADCTRRKSEDDIYDDYVHTAEQLLRKIKSETLVGLLPMVIGASVLMISICNNKMGLVVIGMAFFLSGPIWAQTKSKQVEKAETAEIGKAKPAFPEFYKAWKKQKTKEALMAGLAIAGVVVAGTIAAAAESSSRERRVSEIEEGVRRAMR